MSQHTAEELISIGTTFLEGFESGDWDSGRSVLGEEIETGFALIRPIRLLDAFRLGGDWEHPDEIDQEHWDRVAPFLAEHLTPSGQMMDQDAMVESEQQWKRSFEPIDLSIDYISAVSDEKVVYHVTRRQRHAGSYLGIAPTGNEITTSDLGVLRISDGKIREWRNSWDYHQFMEELGIVPSAGERLKVEEQFHQVVNRLLRHNLRSSLNVIHGLAETIELGGGDAASLVPEIRQESAETIETVKKIRTIERVILDEQYSHSIELTKVIQTIIDEQQTRQESATIISNLPSDSVEIVSQQDLIELALREAIENAIYHSREDQSRVDVTLVEPGPNEQAVTIEIADFGPGIPSYELNPIDKEHETPLEHASGLGLWAISWSVGTLGGSVDFVENVPHGTIVRLSIPTEPPEEASIIGWESI